MLKILFTNWAPIVRFGMGSGFQELGIETYFLYTNENYEAHLLQMIDHVKPDILFTDGGVAFKDIILDVVERTGIPHIYWAIEDPVSYNLSLDYGKKSILVLTTYMEWLKEIYKPNGVNAITIPFAANPQYHRTVPPQDKYRAKFAFVGNNYEVHKYRKKGYQAMFMSLFDIGESIDFYGSTEWIDDRLSFHVPKSMYRGYLGNEELAALCNSVDFILGIHSIGTSLTMQAMRTFEVLGSGGFFFSHYNPALKSMFKNHHHLVWSRSPEETVSLYRFYDKHPELRKKIAAQGQAFVYENHTYRHRAQQILRALPADLRQKAGI